MILGLYGDISLGYARAEEGSFSWTSSSVHKSLGRGLMDTLSATNDIRICLCTQQATGVTQFEARALSLTVPSIENGHFEIGVDNRNGFLLTLESDHN